MIKNWEEFNEGWFSGKKKADDDSGSDIKPLGAKTSTNRPSDEESKSYKKIDSLKSKNIDTNFMQEISDRLYGPDSEEYIEALKKLNTSFRPRPGKFGKQFIDLSNIKKSRERESEVINTIQKDN